jgi:hypothetical protein
VGVGKLIAQQATHLFVDGATVGLRALARDEAEAEGDPRPLDRSIGAAPHRQQRAAILVTADATEGKQAEETRELVGAVFVVAQQIVAERGVFFVLFGVHAHRAERHGRRLVHGVVPRLLCEQFGDQALLGLLVFVAGAAAEQARYRDGHVGLHELIAFAEVAIVVGPEFGRCLPNQAFLGAVGDDAERTEPFDHSDSQVTTLLVLVVQHGQQSVVHTLLHGEFSRTVGEQSEPPGGERARTIRHFAACKLASRCGVREQVDERLYGRFLPRNAKRQRGTFAHFLVAIGEALFEQVLHLHAIGVEADLGERDHCGGGEIAVVCRTQHLGECCGDAVLAIDIGGALRVAREASAGTTEVELVRTRDR